MTPSQLQTLRADIAASPDLLALYNAGDRAGLAAAYNAASTFYVWRTSVTQDEIMLNGFDWAQSDNLTVGQARIWEWLFDNASTAINPSKANVRAGISECWKGTAAKVAVATAVLGHCKRLATRLEQVFSTGTGTLQNPGDLGFEGEVTPELFVDV
jgi:hypothetical protein